MRTAVHAPASLWTLHDLHRVTYPAVDEQVTLRKAIELFKKDVSSRLCRPRSLSAGVRLNGVELQRFRDGHQHLRDLLERYADPRGMWACSCVERLVRLTHRVCVQGYSTGFVGWVGTFFILIGLVCRCLPFLVTPLPCMIDTNFTPHGCPFALGVHLRSFPRLAPAYGAGWSTAPSSTAS